MPAHQSHSRCTPPSLLVASFRSFRVAPLRASSSWSTPKLTRSSSPVGASHTTVSSGAVPKTRLRTSRSSTSASTPSLVVLARSSWFQVYGRTLRLSTRPTRLWRTRFSTVVTSVRPHSFLCSTRTGLRGSSLLTAFATTWLRLPRCLRTTLAHAPVKMTLSSPALPRATLALRNPRCLRTRFARCLSGTCHPTPACARRRLSCSSSARLPSPAATTQPSSWTRPLSLSTLRCLARCASPSSLRRRRRGRSRDRDWMTLLRNSTMAPLELTPGAPQSISSLRCRGGRTPATARATSRAARARLATP
mmetsp:Transcript_2203/g.5112  ORF Transcript_2203/g.5112 Transcript_2203/m.5112 type:complete len:306 (-) Transcript_2203:233-1150(-)